VQSATLASLGLGVAAAWRAALAVADARWIRRVDPSQRVYRAELGWTSADQQAARCRWARVGLAGALGVLGAELGRASRLINPVAARAMTVAACLVIAGWLTGDRRLHHGRYTSVCISLLAVGVALDQYAPDAAGVFASFFAAHLYLVAAIRKLRSRPFMSGRVLADTLAFGLVQAGAGNREFLPLIPASRLPGLVGSRSFLSWSRAAAVVTVFAELALGLGALGLIPPAPTLALAVVLHLTFLLLGPKRLVPFTAGALGLLALAMLHPIARTIP